MWLSQTLSPPRIQVFYTLTKIQKPPPVRRPIISGCDSPAEKISSFVDTLLQPIAQKQQSSINGHNWFHQFYRKNKDKQRNNFSINGRFQDIHKYIPQEVEIETDDWVIFLWSFTRPHLEFRTLAFQNLPWSQRFFFIFLRLRWESPEAAIDITILQVRRSGEKEKFGCPKS